MKQILKSLSTGVFLFVMVYATNSLALSPDCYNRATSHIQSLMMEGHTFQQAAYRVAYDHTLQIDNCARNAAVHLMSTGYMSPQYHYTNYYGFQ